MILAVPPILAAFLVLVLPGWAVLVWLPPADQDGLERLADAVGISIAVSALLAELAFFAKFQYNGPALEVLYGLAILAALVGSLRRVIHWHRGWGRFTPAGLSILAGLLAWRFYQARALVLPAWVDSVHHVLVVRKILESGGLPADLNPYLDVPFFYHYAFHLVTALFAALSLWQPSQSVLWLGQIINALIALSVYRLGKALSFDRWRAGLAALLVGFVLQMPAYYLSWGRYTLSTGLLMLPLAMAAAVDMARPVVESAEIEEVTVDPQKTNKVGNWIRLSLLAAGVCLAHYLAGLLLAIFLFILYLELDRNRRNFLTQKNLVISAGLGGLLVAPWLWRVWQYGSHLAKVAVALPPKQTAFQYITYVVSLLGPYRNHVMMLLAVLGLVWSFFRPSLRRLAIWTALLVLMALPWGIQLNPFRPDQVAIILFLPAALLVSELLMAAYDVLAKKLNPLAAKLTLALAIVGLVGWGLIETADVLNTGTILATQADLSAIQWIQENTPQQAHFFINAALWQTGSYRGVDGGYWLETLAGRRTLVPPAMYGWGARPEINQVNAWARRASSLAGCTDDFWALIKETGSQYVYVKQGVGKLQPDQLNACSGLTVIYRKQGVFIYEVVGP
ncbi:MAG: hypothetical protein P4L50_22400 [Anaerolineaceae bacterium]|nr:hypothetical protein [Anaerolineaceae bacterium]